MVRATDPPPDLMQLGEPKLVGTIDENSISSGDVDTAFDDRGTHQQVATMMIKIQHHLFEIFFLHLSVDDTYPRIGHQGL